MNTLGFCGNIKIIIKKSGVLRFIIGCQRQRFNGANLSFTGMLALNSHLDYDA